MAGFDIAIGQGLEKGDDGILLVVGQVEISELARIQVFGILGRRPARNFLTGIIRPASRQHVARIVEALVTCGNALSKP